MLFRMKIRAILVGDLRDLIGSSEMVFFFFDRLEKDAREFLVEQSRIAESLFVFFDVVVLRPTDDRRRRTLL